ncbi:hypothetical protein [Halorussus aquaticus]|uniref:Uncharacterized protein n=1 Tax=Halorussus aquaticus TaxID=2953748 RepID=A0ABD5Q3A4_9EURY|nr:hypothetical protein [Halorussus aquaticus]
MSSGQPSERAHEPSTAIRIALGVVALLVVLYSLLIATRPLLGVTFVVWLFGAYLLWRFFHLAARFVGAVERIADAMERRTQSGERRTAPEDRSRERYER